MKKLIIILPIVTLLAGCMVIEERYTSPRVRVEPGEEEYYDYQPDYYAPSYYDDPYYYPHSWIGMSWWNPFWYYGLHNYYWGTWGGYWGYYPYGYGYGYGYYSNYYQRRYGRPVVKKGQLRYRGRSGGTSSRVRGTTSTRSSGGKTGSVRSGGSRSAPRVRTGSVRRGGSSRGSSGSKVRKKK